MAPALAPGLVGQEIAAGALLGLAPGAARALLPAKGRAAFLPDLLWVGTLLLALQSYTAALSPSGVLRWYTAATAFFSAFAAETLLRGLLAPLPRPKRRRRAKRTTKKPKKNLPTTRRMLYNSNVSK